MMAGFLLRGLIRCYQLLISPLLGTNCRYLPSCSDYAQEAIQLHGALRGTGMALARIGRCHPWGGSGYDPVPPKGARSHDHAHSHTPSCLHSR